MRQVKLDNGWKGGSSNHLHIVCTFHFSSALVLVNLCEQGLLLLLLLLSFALLFATVFTVKNEAAGEIPALAWVGVVDHFSCSFHFLPLNQLFKLLIFCLVNFLFHGVLGFWFGFLMWS